VRGSFGDFLDVLGKPGVEHLVRLIENQELDAAESGGTATDQIQDPSRTSDDDVGPAQIINLLSVADATEYEYLAQSRLQLGEDRTDLGGQLAGWGHDQGPCRPLLMGPQSFHHGYEEGQGFSRAGGRLNHAIPPRLENRYCGDLNLGGLVYTKSAEGFKGARPHSKFGE
jgi:hypothetical protein